MKSRARMIVMVACALCLSAPVFAAGQTPAATTHKKPAKKDESFKKPSTAPPPGSAQVEEAEKRYDRAVELFNEGSYDASLLEFRRAYQLAPTYKILYNVALVNVELNDYAQALEYFERYLAEGGDKVPEMRRDEVKQQIDKLSGRVATVTIESNVSDARVLVDDIEMSPTVPTTPMRVNSGRRRITLTAKGYVPSTQHVELAGKDAVTLKFELEPPSQAGAVAPGGQQRAERRVPWELWVGTGILAAGTAVTGVLALGANSDLENEKKSYDPAESRDDKRQRLEDLDSKRKTLALVTDVLAGATVVLGGVSLYLTLKSPSKEGQQAARYTPPKPSVQLGVTGRGLAVRGSF